MTQTRWPSRTSRGHRCIDRLNRHDCSGGILRTRRSDLGDTIESVDSVPTDMRSALSAVAVAASTGILYAQVPEQALKHIRPELIRAHTQFLADDLLEGRGTGTRGYQLAANYVAAQFTGLGLAPAFGQSYSSLSRCDMLRPLGLNPRWFSAVGASSSDSRTLSISSQVGTFTERRSRLLDRSSSLGPESLPPNWDMTTMPMSMSEARLSRCYWGASRISIDLRRHTLVISTRE